MGSSTCMSMSARMELERREIERLRVQDYVKNIHSSIPSPSQRISNKHTRTHTHSDRNRAKIVFFRSIAFQYLPSETLHRLFHLHECAWDWFDFASSTPAIKFNEMGKINMWSIGLLKHQISTIKSLNTHTNTSDSIENHSPTVYMMLVLSWLEIYNLWARYLWLP